MEIRTGQQAPQFALYNTEKKLVRLEDYQNRPVVILFFPLAFSSVCTEEMCAVRDSLAEFDKLNAAVLGISVDSLYTLRAFKDEKKLGFELLSDFNKETIQAYGILHEVFSYGMRGVAKRSAFVVDKSGKIVYAEVSDNPGKQPDFEGIKTTLAALD